MAKATLTFEDTEQGLKFTIDQNEDRTVANAAAQSTHEYLRPQLAQAADIMLVISPANADKFRLVPEDRETDQISAEVQDALANAPTV